MVTDVVLELGYLTLGSRMKRIGERLQSQAQTLIAQAGIRVPASHFPVLAALERLGPLSVGDLARAIGISQPAVTRLLASLEAGGLVKSQRAAADRRVRPLTLTRAGRQLVLHSKQQLWPQIEAAVAEACAGPPASLLAQLAAVEQALASVPLQERAARQAERERRRVRA